MVCGIARAHHAFVAVAASKRVVECLHELELDASKMGTQEAVDDAMSRVVTCLQDLAGVQAAWAGDSSEGPMHPLADTRDAQSNEQNATTAEQAQTALQVSGDQLRAEAQQSQFPDREVVLAILQRVAEQLGKLAERTMKDGAQPGAVLSIVQQINAAVAAFVIHAKT
jgi:hypothetical protein